MAEKKFRVGQRLSYGGDLCTVRYIGEVDGTKGEWLGVEWDNVLRGKHSGEHGGRRYFDCTIPNSGSFVRPARVADSPISFLEGLRKKYTTEQDDPHKPHIPVSVSATKVMEEVGFDKIQAKLSQLEKLKVILLDSLCIERADDPELIAQTCPNIEELDLSRNLFEEFADIATICGALKKLRVLRISGNRLGGIESFKVYPGDSPFEHVTTLEINNTLFPWHTTTHLLGFFPSLTTLSCTHNNISTIRSSPSVNLETLDLSHNVLTSLSSITALTYPPSLVSLILSHNAISNLSISRGIAFPAVTFLDLSYNAVPSFPDIDELSPAFPALANLRVSHNPLYEGVSADDAHMLTVARLPAGVTVVNHSTVIPKERVNAEMWYLARIGKELAEAGEEKKLEVLSKHKRWDELCRVHGAPTGESKETKNDKTLRGRLLELEFVAEELPEKAKAYRIPRSTPVSMLRGLAGRMFGMKPLHVQMFLEVTGEERKLLGEEEDAREIGNYVDAGLSGGRVTITPR